jgi:hypothetical protein
MGMQKSLFAWFKARPRMLGAGLVLVVVAGVIATSTVVWERVQQAKAPIPPGGAPTVRRLNEPEYRRSIAYVFGSDIEVPGRFDSQYRDEGLLAIGDASVSLTASSIEQHELRAREIAAQVVEREVVLAALGKPSIISSCDLDGFDQRCVEQFIGHFGRLLYRRQLTESQMSALLSMARAGSEQSGGVFKGLEVGLSRLLMSPNFLFRIEVSELDHEGRQRLDNYSLASRISFLLWGGPPDEQLLDFAESGALRGKKILASEVDRMIASPRFEAGVRAFFYDMLGFEQFDGLSKDQQIFPKFTAALPDDVREQALRTIVKLLVNQQSDYRDLYTTQETFMNRRLGTIYRVPVFAESADEWVEYTFKPEDKRAGYLTLAAFLMLDPTHEGATSPTIRGKTVRELLLCQEVPPPPADVNFDLVRDTDNPNLRTGRERLIAHSESPTCAGCHALTDPLGLGMEHYDAVGEHRITENGALIDASGNLEGEAFENLLEIGQIMHDSPTAAACLAQRVYEYGLGRSVVAADRKWLNYLMERTADKGFVFVELLRDIATSEAFWVASELNDFGPEKTALR